MGGAGVICGDVCICGCASYTRCDMLVACAVCGWF